jgi:predicted DNA-binding transcriptional regulator YafY
VYTPASRLLTVLELLQARGRLPGAELARRLEVDPRSVRRYVTMLQDMGIPIEGARGPGGGYRLRPGYKLPPLMLTGDEAVAVCLGLRALPRLGLLLPPETATGAAAKIERVLPDPLRRRVRALQSGVALDAPPPAAPAGLVALLGEAAAQGRPVWLRYRSPAGAETERLVDPYGVVAWSRSWYVAGYCHLRRGLRSFRLDRVAAAEPRDGAFAPPEDFDALDFVLRSVAAMPGVWPVEVVLRAGEAQARARIPPAFGTLETVPGGVVFSCRYDDLDGLARFLVTLGLPLTVHRPPELRDALRRLARDIRTWAAPPAGRREAPVPSPPGEGDRPVR